MQVVATAQAIDRRAVTPDALSHTRCDEIAYPIVSLTGPEKNHCPLPVWRQVAMQDDSNGLPEVEKLIYAQRKPSPVEF